MMIHSSTQLINMWGVPCINTHSAHPYMQEYYILLLYATVHLYSTLLPPSAPHQYSRPQMLIKLWQHCSILHMLPACSVHTSQKNIIIITSIFTYLSARVLWIRSLTYFTINAFRVNESKRFHRTIACLSEQRNTEIIFT